MLWDQIDYLKARGFTEIDGEDIVVKLGDLNVQTFRLVWNECDCNCPHCEGAEEEIEIFCTCDDESCEVCLEVGQAIRDEYCYLYSFMENDDGVI